MSVSDALIADIHRSGYQTVIAVTGGGAGAIGRLLSVPGGSKSVLAAVVPYSHKALYEWLRGEPANSCSEETARAMAVAAWRKAREFAADDAPRDKLLGVSCTASLVSDRPKRGEHRAHLAIHSADSTRVATLMLTKGEYTRGEEEALVGDWLLQHLALRCGVASVRTLPYQEASGTTDLARLMDEQIPALRLGADVSSKPPQVIFPGAFNPRHAGHEAMAIIAAELLQRPVEFEISIENVDKLPLDHLDLSRRLKLFKEDEALWLTRAPTFVRKSELFPGATFLVGADTIVRIAQPKYYGNDPQARDAALARIAGNGCRFLVFGRVREEQYQTLANLTLPPALLAICQQVPESLFRCDISSTELRQQSAQQQQ